MSKQLEKLKKMASKAGAKQDQSKRTAGGGGDFTPPPAGWTPARFVGYVEMGVQPGGKYQGKPKPDVDQVRLIFELLGEKHIRELDDGRKVCNRYEFNIKKSLHPKASFAKLFDQMAEGHEGITHFGQLLGEAFRIKISHNVVKKDGKDITYVNISDKAGYNITPPRKPEYDEDENITGYKKIKVPEMMGEPKLFLFDEPTQEAWDALFIDGEKEVKGDDGETTTKSRNWLQEKITQAKNFKGSALEQMVGGLDDLAEFNEDSDEDDADDLEDDEDEAPKKKKTKEAPKSTKKAKPPVDEDEDEDDADEESEDEDEEEEADDEEAEESDESDDESDEDESDEDEDDEEEKPKAKAKAKAAPAKKPAKVTKPVTKKAPASVASSKTKSPSKDKAKAKKGANALADIELFDDED